MLNSSVSLEIICMNYRLTSIQMSRAFSRKYSTWFLFYSEFKTTKQMFQHVHVWHLRCISKVFSTYLLPKKQQYSSFKCKQATIPQLLSQPKEAVQVSKRPMSYLEISKIEFSTLLFENHSLPEAERWFWWGLRWKCLLSPQLIISWRLSGQTRPGGPGRAQCLMWGSGPGSWLR